MSSIITKRRGGSTYLYAATSARVQGRPRIVEQVYLGTEDEVIARLTATPGGDPGLPETEHRRFWDAMDAVTVEQLDQIEAVLTKRMIEVFGLDTHALIGGHDQLGDVHRLGQRPGADRAAGQGPAETL